MKLLHENSRWENGGGLFLAMPSCQAPQTFGFFDVELRVQWLLTKGNRLSRLDAVVDWEQTRPLTEAQKESNRQKSKIGVWIEHVFGYMSQSMKGFYLRYIGRRRNAAAIGRST